MHPMTSLPQKQCHLVVGHTLSYIVSNFEANLTNSPQDTAIFVSSPLFFLIWPLSDSPASETWLQIWPHNNWSPSLPRPLQMPLLVCWQLGQHPSACQPMTGIPKMLTTLSPYFAVPWRTGSSSTAFHQTAGTTSGMFLQPWEPNPWRCMHNGCQLAVKRNRKWPRQKLLLSSTESRQGMTHDVNTHVHLGELKDIVARLEEDPQDLVACIKTLMDHCKMINDEHCKHELHCCIVHAYCHKGKPLGKLMAKPFKTPSNELADIAVNHFAIQHAREQVSHSSKPVDTICQDKRWMVHTSHSSNGHTPPAPSKDCPNCTQQHQTGRANCPACWFPLFQMWQNGTLGTKMPWWQATPTKECTSTWVTAEEVQMPT